MIRHILKDGTEVVDITGHVIKAKEHRTLYEVINRIQRKEKQHEQTNSNRNRGIDV